MPVSSYKLWCFGGRLRFDGLLGAEQGPRATAIAQMHRAPYRSEMRNAFPDCLGDGVAAGVGTCCALIGGQACTGTSLESVHVRMLHLIFHSDVGRSVDPRAPSLVLPALSVISGAGCRGVGCLRVCMAAGRFLIVKLRCWLDFPSMVLRVVSSMVSIARRRQIFVVGDRLFALRLQVQRWARHLCACAAAIGWLRGAIDDCHMSIGRGQQLCRDQLCKEFRMGICLAPAGYNAGRQPCHQIHRGL